MLNELLLGLLGFTGGVVIEDVSAPSFSPLNSALAPSTPSAPRGQVLNASSSIAGGNIDGGALGSQGNPGTFRLHPCFDLASDAERVGFDGFLR